MDLLLELRGRLVPIEIKLGTAIPDVHSLQTCMSDLGLKRGYVVTMTPKPMEIAAGIHMLNLRALLEELGLRPRPAA